MAPSSNVKDPVSDGQGESNTRRLEQVLLFGGFLQDWRSDDPAALVCQDTQVFADGRHGREGAGDVQYNLSQTKGLKYLKCEFCLTSFTFHVGFPERQFTTQRES